MQDVREEFIDLLNRILKSTLDLEDYIFITLVKSKKVKNIVSGNNKYHGFVDAFGYSNEKLIQYFGNYRISPIVIDNIWFETIYYGGIELNNEISIKFRNSEIYKRSERSIDDDGSLLEFDSKVSIKVSEGENIPKMPGIVTVLIDINRARDVLNEFLSDKPMFDKRGNNFVYKNQKAKIPRKKCSKALELLLNNLGKMVNKKDFYCYIYDDEERDYRLAGEKRKKYLDESAEKVFKNLKKSICKNEVLRDSIDLVQNDGYGLFKK